MFYVNGAYVPALEAKISVLDLGLTRGLGVFDYLRTYQGRPFHLYDHLLRLSYSAERLGLELPVSLEEISRIIARLLSENRFPEAGIKIIVTGGVSSDPILPDGKASLAILVYPFTPLPERYKEEGISAITTEELRPLADAKTLHYAPAILALQKGKRQGAQEALYLSAQKDLLEATTSNFFAIKKGVLCTPPDAGILLGITRGIVLRLAREVFPIKIGPIAYGELEECDEAFLTSSNKEVMPLIAIDARPIGNGHPGSGRPGPCTRKLQELFAAYTAQSHWPLLSISRYPRTVKNNSYTFAQKNP